MKNETLENAGAICSEYLEIAEQEQTKHEVGSYCGDMVIRWKPNINLKHIDVNEMTTRLERLGYDKNSETYEGNNENLNEYVYCEDSELMDILKEMKWEV